MSIKFSSDLNTCIYQILFATQRFKKFLLGYFPLLSKEEITIGIQSVKSSIFIPYVLNTCRKDFPLSIETSLYI